MRFVFREDRPPNATSSSRAVSDQPSSHAIDSEHGFSHRASTEIDRGEPSSSEIEAESGRLASPQRGGEKEQGLAEGLANGSGGGQEAVGWRREDGGRGLQFWDGRAAWAKPDVITYNTLMEIAARSALRGR